MLTLLQKATPFRRSLSRFSGGKTPRLSARLGGIAMVLLLANSCTHAPPSRETAPTPSFSTEQSRKRSTASTRAADLLKAMTLEEKIAYLSGYQDFFIRPLERLNIPAIKMADGPAGCRNWGPSTAYPAAIGVAATFDPRLSERLGDSLGRDCRARGVHILLAPGVNIARSPLGGRNFEYLGEDPLLARMVSTSLIVGVQAAGVLATVKHFALNNQEWDRRHVSSEVSERALREIYLPAFEGAVKDAHVGAVMTAYNLVDGSYASHSARLLHDILRKEWGFSGFVMSDWAAIQDTRASMLGGTDLEMPRAEYWTTEKLLPLLESGELTEKLLDEKVGAILRTLIAAGFFDREQTIPRPVDDPKSREVALQVARRSLVLLKNDPPQAAKAQQAPKRQAAQPLLPLSRALTKVAIVGPNAHPAVHGGSGSAYVTPAHTTSLVDAVRFYLPDAEIVTHPGIRQKSGFEALGAPIFSGPVRQEIFQGKSFEGPALATSEVDRIDFAPQGKSPAWGVGAEHYSIRWTGELVVERTKVHRFVAHADDGVRVFIDGAEVLSDWSDHPPRLSRGDITLSPGKHRVVVEYFQGILGALCQFGLEQEQTGAFFGKDDLARTIDGADVVLAAVGFGQHTEQNSLGTAFEPFWPPPWARDAGVVEAEDDDRPFSLPSAQRETLALVASHPKAVVIGFAGGGVDFEPWLAKVPALLWAWYPGQEGGRAIADVLFGAENPSGRLPVTFAAKYSDHPASSSYHVRIPIDAEQHGRGPRLEACQTLGGAAPPQPSKSDGPLYLTPYCEGVFVGYRGFDRQGTSPLFPFGYGLSYTRFRYESLATSKDAEGRFSALVTVSNQGDRAGREVVQIYVAPRGPASPAPTEARPLQQLAGFAVTELDPGASKTLTIPLSSRAFSRYRPGKGWMIPAGAYEIRASSSSRDHHRRATLVLEETWE